MERGSTKHGPMLDEEIKQETEGAMRSGQVNRAEQDRETEAVRPDDTDAEVRKAEGTETG